MPILDVCQIANALFEDLAAAVHSSGCITAIPELTRKWGNLRDGDIRAKLSASESTG
jgi:hypothetical protein